MKNRRKINDESTFLAILYTLEQRAQAPLQLRVQSSILEHLDSLIRNVKL